MTIKDQYIKKQKIKSQKKQNLINEATDKKFTKQQNPENSTIQQKVNLFNIYFSTIQQNLAEGIEKYDLTIDEFIKCNN